MERQIAELVRQAVRECLVLALLAVLGWVLFTVGATPTKLSIDSIATIEAHRLQAR